MWYAKGFYWQEGTINDGTDINSGSLESRGFGMLPRCGEIVIIKDPRRKRPGV